MSKFFVGQRVRMVNVSAFEHGDLFEGFETRILGRALDMTVDGYWALDDAGKWPSGLWVHENHLEPILPDGHRAGEEGECTLLDELLERQREAA